MYWRHNATPEQKIQEIQRRAKAAEEYWKRLREEIPQGWAKGYYTSSATFSGLLNTDAELEVWLTLAHIVEDNEGQTPEVAMERVIKHIRRQVTHWSGHNSTNEMSNVIDSRKHQAWLEAMEELDSAW